MFVLKPIGFVESPYTDSKEIPRGLGAKHHAEGILRILPEFEAGLADIGQAANLETSPHPTRHGVG